MRYFDLHCDTLCACCDRETGLFDNGLHVDFSKALSLPYIQCCAAWIDDIYRKEDAFNRFKAIYTALEKEESKGGFTVIRSKNDLIKVTEESAVGVIPTIEGAAAFAGKLENIDKIADLGIKMVTLTWNGSNEVGSGIGDEEADFGLTEFGRAAVKRMNDRNMIVDVSHASEKLFYDVCEYSEMPFAASHSNAKSLCSHRRNLTDQQFSEIVRRGGLVGINFYKDFLDNDPEKASMEAIFEHADYFLSKGGEDIVAMGSDFDGSDIPDDLNGVAGIPNLYDIFLRHNYSEDLVDKLFYRNALEFMCKFYK